MELFETESKVYNDYLRRKIAGETLDINDVTPEELEDMVRYTINGNIADLFNVSRQKVSKLRQDLGVGMYQLMAKDYIQSLRGVDFILGKEQN